MPGPKEPPDLLRAAEHGAVSQDATPDSDPAPPTARVPSLALRVGETLAGETEPNQALSTERALTVSAAVTVDQATLTVLSGVTAGQVFTLDRDDQVLGRGADAQVWIDEATISRAHARITRKPDDRFLFEDLRSTNGSFVQGRQVKGRGVELRDEDRVQLGPHLMLRFAFADASEASMQRRLYESSTRDALTRAYNRRYLFERLAAEIGYCRRHKSELTVLMLDLDRFKQVNDTYGHLAGDAVLHAVAQHVQRAIRIEDVFARYGGEEFVIVARATPASGAAKLAERVRMAIEGLRIPVPGRDSPLSVTVSIGIASFSRLPPETAVTELIGAADAHLYRAKSTGRNRVCGEG